MRTWKVILAASLVVGIALVTASAFAMGNGIGFLGMHGTYAPNNNGYYGGMMGSGGMMGNYGYYPQTTSPTQPNYAGPGCGNHDLIGPYATNGTALNPITINTALTNAQNYVTSLNNPDFTVKQIEEYTNNFYVQVTEKSTGNGAFELLVNKYTGTVGPEMGPNMMWNTKYGAITTRGYSMMGQGGMMGMMNGYGYTGTPTTTVTVTASQAKTDAQQYLNTSYAGTTTGDITTFYGHYTIEVLNNGNTYGMISVNGYTGQVWFHTWHGTFVQELQVS